MRSLRKHASIKRVRVGGFRAGVSGCKMDRTVDFYEKQAFMNVNFKCPGETFYDSDIFFLIRINALFVSDFKPKKNCICD